jgi:hypothetical protein
MKMTIVWILMMLAAAPGWCADGGEKHYVAASLDVQLYGYARLDMAYDTARVVPGDYALYVKSEAVNTEDNQLSITANQSRLGLNLSGPDWAGGKMTGKFEIDFYGGGPENKSNILLRQAFAELSWPDYGLSLLAGQAWDLVSPLVPDTVNFLACANAGEIGYRRPQLRLTEVFVLTPQSKLTLKTALARTLGTAASTGTGTNIVSLNEDSGKDSGVPTVQGSVAYTFPLLGKQPALVGVSGHWAREEYDLDTHNTYKLLPSYSLSLDLAFPVTDDFCLKANLWKGTDLATYLGGIGQGINTATVESINSEGGWVSVGLGPWVGVKTNVGASVELPQLDQLQTGDRSQNTVLFINAFYQLTPAVQIAGEVSSFRTFYKNQTPGDAVRYQTALIYGF